MAREFHAEPAEREPTNLFIGLVGPSSSGKTFTAILLAQGIQDVMGGDIAVVDTENKRAKQYADEFRKPDGSPGFLHVPFEPPYSSLDYIAAIEFAAAKVGRNGTVIVDSMSHEHEGEGGLLEWHERETENMAKDRQGVVQEWKKNSVQMLAWAKPKAARRKLLQRITRLNCNVIMCFRAKETSKPGKEKYEQNGQIKERTTVVPLGFIPIAGDEFVFEMSLSALFLPGARGTPTWDSDFPGEKLAIKVPAHLEWIKQHKGSLDRQVGRRLAQWAVGAAPAGAQGRSQRSATQDGQASQKAASGPEIGPADDHTKWADDLDVEHGKITASTALRDAFNKATKTDEWIALKEHHPKRAQAMKDERMKRIASLKQKESSDETADS